MQVPVVGLSRWLSCFWVTVWLQTSSGVCARQWPIHCMLPFPEAAAHWTSTCTLSIWLSAHRCICVPGQAGPSNSAPVTTPALPMLLEQGEAWSWSPGHEISRAHWPRNSWVPNPQLACKGKENWPRPHTLHLNLLLYTKILCDMGVTNISRQFRGLNWSMTACTASLPLLLPP